VLMYLVASSVFRGVPTALDKFSYVLIGVLIPLQLSIFAFFRSSAEYFF
jgi:hypothetical protein